MGHHRIKRLVISKAFTPLASLKILKNSSPSGPSFTYDGSGDLAWATRSKTDHGYATAIDNQGRLILVLQASDQADIAKILKKIAPDEIASEKPQFYSN
jgi:hypothetical protein